MLVLWLVVAMTVPMILLLVTVTMTTLFDGASTSEVGVSGVGGGVTPATISVNLVVLIEDCEVTLLILLVAVSVTMTTVTVVLLLVAVAMTLLNGASSAHVRVCSIGESVAPASVSVVAIVLVEDGAIRGGVAAVALTVVAKADLLVDSVARVGLAALGVIVVVVSGGGNGASVARPLSGELRVATSLVLAASQAVGSGDIEEFAAMSNLPLSHMNCSDELLGSAGAIDTASVAKSATNSRLGQIVGSGGLVVKCRGEASDSGQGKRLLHDEFGYFDFNHQKSKAYLSPKLNADRLFPNKIKPLSRFNEPMNESKQHKGRSILNFIINKRTTFKY